ncbi:uncharacterized protein NAREPO1_00180 [endosymbiont of Euscepes postfasciatus]|uniref:mechanosensitive ion channel domain-containing protein n=1 Tax=endosymbiont of Euscepes postfasciatus TaxID=650377 RepID=UPI000DC70E36|nr:mechanosensitive ion channel domain-containing protein [endosymbiont of Euscepes postfasciatus]BBA84559.1 uncharacterized protein NAREPO1_00180 [endosymbiont of Euscepes postfasciatus]
MKIFLNIFKIFIIMISILFLQYILLIIKKMLDNKIEDKTVNNFLILLMRYFLYILLITLALESLSFKSSSLIAMTSTLIITIGLGLKNTLSNLASGILIILLELFKKDDYIEIDKMSGFVKNIKIFTTDIITLDKNIITIPNNKFLNNSIINFLKFSQLEIKIYTKNENFIEYKKNIISILNKFKNKKKIISFDLIIEEININYTELKIKILIANAYDKEKIKSIFLNKILLKINNKNLV